MTTRPGDETPLPAAVAAEGRPGNVAYDDRRRHSLPESLQSLASTVTIAVFVITFIVQAFQIPSSSMEDTLLIGDYVLVDKIKLSEEGHFSALLPYKPVARGDIIVFKYPVNPDQHFVKRVIGLPGDRLRIANNSVFVNGKLMREEYVVHKDPGHQMNELLPRTDRPDREMTSAWWSEMGRLNRNGELLIPRGHYFVMGDNRDRSLDSRYWGLVPRDNIIGKPWMVYFSINKDVLQAASLPADGKIIRLWNVARDWPSAARWNRSFRFVE